MLLVGLMPLQGPKIQSNDDPVEVESVCAKKIFLPHRQGVSPHDLYGEQHANVDPRARQEQEENLCTKG
jgi:hypothetical protein